MNEELKIIVKAVTDGAKKNLAGVKEELKNIQGESQKAGKTVGESMKGVAKGVGIALAAFTALIGAMVALTKKSMEFQKSYNRLISGFQSSGSTIAQATKTYKELFGFMGEADTATEASNLLVKLTNDEQQLAEWTQILKGVYATFPDSLPVEALAESANETARVGQVTGNLADALNWAGVSEDAFNAKLAQTNSLAEREAMIRQTLNGLYGAAASIYDRNNQKIIQYNEAQARLDIAIANATRNVTPMLTALSNMGAVIVTVLTPAFETVSAVVIVFVQWVTNAIQAIGAFFGIVGGVSDSTNSYSEGLKRYYSDLDKYFDSVNGKNEETANTISKIRKQLMGFDELNVVSSPEASGGATGGGGGIGGGGNMPKLTDYVNLEEATGIDAFQEKLEKVREAMKFLVPLIGLGALAWAGWNLTKFIMELGDATKEVKALKEFSERMDVVWKGLNTTQFKAGLKELWALVLPFIGGFLAIGGALVAIWGATDAWVNGVDWANFAATIGGLTAMVGGLAILFGPLGALIGVIAGAITMLVVGVKDLVTNGYNLVSAIMATVGAGMLLGGLGTAIGAPWLGLFALLSGGFYILYNECETFRKFVNEVWAKIKTSAKDAWEWIKKNILEPIKNIWLLWIKPTLDKIVEIVLKVVEIIGALFVGLWNLLKQEVIDPMVKGFKQAWADIKEFFAPAVNFFGDIFKKAYEKIKEKFSPVKKFFTDLWKDIKTIFKDLGTVIGDAIGGAVKSTINKIISSIENKINAAVSLINGAIGLINKLPGVKVEKLTKLSLPKLATGGIVTRSTIANIGEAGREAVLPLENNTGWMDMLADRIASRQGAPSKIVLALDGKELGYATINSINNITRQTGTLQLAII